MKNLLLTLLFLSGVSISQMAAQSCCAPCPPGCCVTSCAPGKNASIDNKAGNLNATATCTPEQMKACTPEQQKSCAKSMSAGKPCPALNSAAAAPQQKSGAVMADAKPVARKVSVEKGE